MIRLAREASSFGRHETFHLRFGWLTKGYRQVEEDAHVFDSDDATVRLGVGKNMVNAIRYWLVAFGIIKHDLAGYETTHLGRRIFGDNGWDPYLEDDGTIWLLHWLLASNAKDATTFFWFFNRFSKPEFSPIELLTSLKTFTTESLASRISESTLKHDIAVLLRMYQHSQESKRVGWEESLDSPMSALGLISPTLGTKHHSSNLGTRLSLPPSILGYALVEQLIAYATSSIPLERILRSDGVVPAPGAVFRLSEEGLLAKIDELMAWHPGLFEIRESAGIHQIYMIADIEAIDILSKHYTFRIG